MLAALEILRRFPGYRGLIDDLVMTAYCIHILRGDARTASPLLEEAIALAPAAAGPAAEHPLHPAAAGGGQSRPGPARGGDRPAARGAARQPAAARRRR